MVTFKTKFRIPEMDCHAEEQLIRLRLQNFTNIQSLQLSNKKREEVILPLLHLKF